MGKIRDGGGSLKFLSGYGILTSCRYSRPLSLHFSFEACGGRGGFLCVKNAMKGGR